MNLLEKHNQRLEAEILKTKAVVEREAQERVLPAWSSYPVPSLRRSLEALIVESLPPFAGEARIEYIGTRELREKFGDYKIMVPGLLKDPGKDVYIKELAPQLVQALKDSSLGRDGTLAAVEQQGIYVNLRLGPDYLLRSLDFVLRTGPQYGCSDLDSAERVLLDYSAPNTAKQLHAGHIRSTIIGDVLANLHTALGATVFRVNHINDLGGFGFLLEGYRCWQKILSPELSPNERLVTIYGIRRDLEKAAAEPAGYDQWTPALRDTIDKYLGPCRDLAEFQAKYADYVQAADAAFARFERGEAAEVQLWEQMVAWSMQSFQEFYDLLGIHLDFVIGESFYLAEGTRVIAQGRQSGGIYRFTAELAAAETKLLAAKLAAAEISPAVFEHWQAELERDIGAMVVPLGEHQRLVVQRSDGRSIYATRDLGAVSLRVRLFNPTQLIYVAGQEQRVHFQDFFAAARLLGLAAAALKLEHIYFGFYVNSETKEKLASRDGAANVNELLREAMVYFENKYETDSTIPVAERKAIARQLAVGSVIFNDLKKDKKGAVEIHPDRLQTIAEFESAGGAYVVYSACRARSIIRKFKERYQREIPAAAAVAQAQLEPVEIELINRVRELPEQVVAATRQNDPAILLRHLLETARAYNSYYQACPVIKGEQVQEHRLVITAAIAQSLENGLRLCHIECPQRI